MTIITDFAYTPLLKQRLLDNLHGFRFISKKDEAPKAAAVAITIFQHDHQAAVVVTRRSTRLNAHTGQWAIPGGRVDEGETSHQAALRELEEEVCLKLSASHIIGVLDDYVTRSGFVITPLVVWASTDQTGLTANPDEVASIHAFSFNELIRADSPNLETIPESERQVLSMNYLDDRIYSPTAAMLYQFREVAILGKKTRVAHYDQPVFAWK